MYNSALGKLDVKPQNHLCLSYLSIIFTGSIVAQFKISVNGNFSHLWG